MIPEPAIDKQNWRTLSALAEDGEGLFGVLHCRIGMTEFSAAAISWLVRRGFATLDRVGESVFVRITDAGRERASRPRSRFEGPGCFAGGRRQGRNL